MIYDEIALWGLTDQSTIAEILDTSFFYLKKQGGRVSLSTIKNGYPESRIISLQQTAQ